MRDFSQVKKIHLIGVGGAGMSSLAQVFLAYGFQVSGYDDVFSSIIQHLKNKGMQIDEVNSTKHLEQADLIIYSAAIQEDHFQKIVANHKKKKCIKRAYALGLLLKNKTSISIAGIHGKTTTTLLCSHLFQNANQSPTVLAGGALIGEKTGAFIGKDPLMIVEADEFDRSFLQLFSTYSILLNLEAEHLDCYADFNDLENSFIRFIEQTQKKVFLNIDCENLEKLLQKLPVNLKKKVMTFSVQKSADFYASKIQFQKNGSLFLFVSQINKVNQLVNVPLFGKYNVSNTVAVLAVACYFKKKFINFDFDTAVLSLSKFKGVARRMEFLGVVKKITFYDDYAHHPEEVKNTLMALKNRFDQQRIVVVFQPHLYSRTKDFYQEFAESLSLANEIFLAPIFPAREKPMKGVTSNLIAEQMKKKSLNVQVFKNNSTLIVTILKELQAGDVCVWMGAGDIRYTIGNLVINQL